MREERRDRNFPSGIFLPRKAAGKEISSCIFLQAADISRRLRAHVASLRDFASLDSLLFVQYGGHDETRDRRIDKRTGSGHDDISDLVCNDVSVLYSRYLIKIGHSPCLVRNVIVFHNEIVSYREKESFLFLS